VRLGVDVFRVAGALPTWHQTLMGACLAWGEDTFSSHRSGAQLWEAPGFDGCVIELTVPRGRRRVAPGTVHRSVLRSGDTTSRQGIPVTSPDRTLLDLAGIVAGTRVEEAMDDFLRRRITTVERLRRRIEREARPGRRGIATLRTLVEARAEGAVPQSVFETRFLRELRRARLPEPVRQYEVQLGTRSAFLDFAYPEPLIAIETDGRRWHTGRRRWERDLARRNALTMLGWRIIHVTWSMLRDDPDAVMADVERALRGV
jgi:very-short-patch-repair endonuclease